MKTLLLTLVLFTSINLFAQKTGKIFYQNVDSVNKSKQEFKNLGIEIDFAPIKIDLQYVPKIQKWDGEKPFEIPHVLSKIYFTTFVTEYSDKFILQIKVAEELKK
jgi:hypothetical protein